MIIDFHTHYYPDKIVERALECARNAGINAVTDGTRDGLVRSMREAGIDYSIALPLANTPDNVRGVNRWAQLQNQAPVFLLGSIHPFADNPDKLLKQIAAMGLKGIKVHPEYQDFSFDDERLFPLWEACINNDIFVITHAGEDSNFKPPYKSNPKSLLKFHQRFSALKLIIAHLGSFRMWDEAEEHIAGLPVYLDLAFTLGHIPDDQLIRIIRKHGAERILFGTDSPWCDQAQAVKHLRSLPLDEHEKELILGLNAARLLNIGPQAK